MRRYAALLVVAALLGCHSSKKQGAFIDGSAVPSSRSPGVSQGAALFSRPIGAARGAGGVTFVAGLVVPRNAIAVTLLGRDGSTQWTHDLIMNVTWSANATLTLLRSGAGVTAVWRGRQGQAEVTVAARVGADGQLLGEPFSVGAAACTTDTDLAWVERTPGHCWLVKTQGFLSTASSPALTIPEDRDPSLACTPHRVLALGDGEDDVTLSAWDGSAHAPLPPLRVMQANDFRGDDERGHELYEVGDDVGVVRIGSRGRVAVREVIGNHAGLWRRLSGKLTETDDVVLVDADPHTALVAFTHEAEGAGDVSGASSVQALVWERGGTREGIYALAPAAPSFARGPFWSGAVPGGVVVAWAERSARVDGGEAPIVGLTYRLVSIDGLGEAHRLSRAADDLVDAGCDDAHCYAVALARAAGDDGGEPEAAKVLSYP